LPTTQRTGVVLDKSGEKSAIALACFHSKHALLIHKDETWPEPLAHVWWWTGSSDQNSTRPARCSFERECLMSFVRAQKPNKGQGPCSFHGEEVNSTDKTF